MFSDRSRYNEGGAGAYSPPTRARNQKLLQRRQRRFGSLENVHSDRSSMPSTADGQTPETDRRRGNHQAADSRATSQDDDEEEEDEEEGDVEEEVLTDLQYHHAKRRRGKLVTFYRNGDPHFRGLRTSVSRKMFATLGTLLAWLNEKISTEHGVKHIFSLPDGSTVRKIAQFVGGRSYVVSSVRRIIHVPYGDAKERFWRNRSVEKLTPELGVRQRPKQQQPQPGTTRIQRWQQPAERVPAPSLTGRRAIERVSGPYTSRGDYGTTSKASPPLQTPPIGERDSSPTRALRRPRRESDDRGGRTDPTTPPRRVGGNHPPPPSVPLSTRHPYSPPTLPPSIAGSVKGGGRGSKSSSPISNGGDGGDGGGGGGEFFPPKASMAPPRILLIRSNTDRGSRQRVIFNPFTSQSYEDVLVDVRNMVNIRYPPVTALYTANPPFVKVMGLSHLARDLKDCHEFIACGRESFPVELQPGADPTKPPKTDTRVGERGGGGGGGGGPLPPSETSRNSVRSSQSLDRSDSGVKSFGSEYGSADESRNNKTFRVISKPTQNRAETATKSSPDSDVKRVYIHGQTKEFYSPTSGDNEEPASKKPNKTLALNWVYGYRGRDVRDNLFVLPSGELLYSVGAVTVVYDRNRDAQRHYAEHREDVVCMAVHFDGGEAVIATGQLSGKSSETRAHVRIWNSRTLKTYAVLGKDMMLQSVNSVGFSKRSGNQKDGSFVAAVDGGERHLLTVWDWRKQTLMAKTSVTTELETPYDLVTSVSFHPDDYKVIITFGSQHINFWKLSSVDDSQDESAQMQIIHDKKSGHFEAGLVPSYVTSLTYGQDGDVITGDSRGQITVWSRSKSSDAFQINKSASEHLRNAHKKSVLSLAMLEDGTLLSGGGSEVKAWNSKDNFRLVKERTLPEGMAGFVRSVVPLARNSLDGAFYVGLTDNDVLQGSFQDKFSYVIQGHSEELWAVVSHPTQKPIFATAGYDQLVCQWNATKHRLIWKVQVEKPCISIDYDPSGRRLVVGTTVGRFIVLSAESGQHIVSMQVDSESLDVTRFSPDGRLLAVGCQNGNIYLFDVLDDCQVYRKHKIGILKGHQNVVSHLDWSKDGDRIRSVSGDYDLKFWTLDSTHPLPASDARNVTWCSQSCILGYNVLGPWSDLKEGEDINVMSRSLSGSLLAVGNNKGQVRLYTYPSVNGGSDNIQQKICTGNVTRVTFANDDRLLLSAGGTDAAVMQWSLANGHDE